jgi:hypothetical protein
MKYEVSGYADHKIVSMTIPEVRCQEVCAARRTCFFALEIEEKCALLIDNYYEFECELLKLAQASAIWPHLEHSDSMLKRLSLDRRIVNLLTACRLYLDQTEHAISSLFGDSSTELASFRKLRKDLYGSHWGYRLMEAIRNHVQHAGLVAHGITHSMSSVDGRLKNYTQQTVSPTTNAETLATNPDFKKSVLEELRRFKQPIDLRPPLREYVSCLVRLHEHVREIMRARLEEDREVYEAAVKEFATVSGKAVSFARLRVLNDDRTIKEERPLVTEFLGYHDLLRKRFSARSDLERICASNSIQERA